MLIFCLSRVKFNQFDPRFLRFAIRFDSFTTECGSMQSSFDDGRFNISFFASLSPWGWFSVLIGPEMKEPLLASHFDSIFSQSRPRDKSRFNCSSGISTPPSLPCRNPKFLPHVFSRFRRGSVLNCEVEFRMEEIKASLEIDILSLWFICPPSKRMIFPPQIFEIMDVPVFTVSN